MLDIRVKSVEGNLLKELTHQDLGNGHYRFVLNSGIVLDTYQDGPEDSFTTNGRITLKDGVIYIAPV